jgi:hypothetical protein
MKTVSLEEVLKRAMAAPLSCRKGDESVLGQFFDIEKDGKHVGCGGAGELGFHAVDRNRCTFALLVHAFNLFPEVVEALKDVTDALADYESDLECPKGPAHSRAEVVLAKAETIELPE